MSSPKGKKLQPVVAGFVFASRAMREFYQHIEAAADSDINVMLTGETGTGNDGVSSATAAWIQQAVGQAGRYISRSTTMPARNALDAARQDGEMQRLVKALTKHDNNRTQTAKELGISRVALYKKLHKFGLAAAQV